MFQFIYLIRNYKRALIELKLIEFVEYSMVNHGNLLMDRWGSYVIALREHAYVPLKVLLFPLDPITFNNETIFTLINNEISVQ